MSGSRFYVAPEMVESLKYNFATDYYALGIIIWEIFEQQIPFYHIKEFHDDNYSKGFYIDNKIQRENLRPIFTDKITIYPELKNVIQQLWDKDYQERSKIDLATIFNKIASL